MPTPIPFSDVTIDDDRNCCISGDGASAMRDALIRKQPNTMGELADKYTYVDPNEITIDDQGRVIISNPTFSDLVENALGADGTVSFLDTNCSCGGH